MPYGDDDNKEFENFDNNVAFPKNAENHNNNVAFPKNAKKHDNNVAFPKGRLWRAHCVNGSEKSIQGISCRDTKLQKHTRGFPQGRRAKATLLFRKENSSLLGIGNTEVIHTKLIASPLSRFAMTINFYLVHFVRLGNNDLNKLYNEKNITNKNFIQKIYIFLR